MTNFAHKLNPSPEMKMTGYAYSVYDAQKEHDTKMIKALARGVLRQLDHTSGKTIVAQQYYGYFEADQEPQGDSFQRVVNKEEATRYYESTASSENIIVVDFESHRSESVRKTA